MFKLAINAGHGKNTAGKRCHKSLDPKETREWWLNQRIVTKIITKLNNYAGIEICRLDDPTGKIDYALKTRTNKANSFNADFYLAIHHNATAGNKVFSGGGVVAFVWDKSKANSPEVQWRDALYKAIIAKTGLKGNRAQPLAKADLHEVRESKMPAVLIECGFMTSTVDVPIILTDKFAEQVADACVEVIVAKGGLKKKVASTPVAPVTAPVKKATVTQSKYFTKYTGRSNSIVDALKAIGVDSSYSYRNKIASKNNIAVYLGTAKQNTQLLALLKQGKLIRPSK